jgi:hypothetical protein
VRCVRPFEDWGKRVGDVPSATAILDRFLHHAEVIAITGRSYRLRNQAAISGKSPAAPTPANAPISDPGSTEHVAATSNTGSAKRRSDAGQIRRKSQTKIESIA